MFEGSPQYLQVPRVLERKHGGPVNRGRDFIWGQVLGSESALSWLGSPGAFKCIGDSIPRGHGKNGLGVGGKFHHGFGTTAPTILEIRTSATSDLLGTERSFDREHGSKAADIPKQRDTEKLMPTLEGILRVLRKGLATQNSGNDYR
ncbi:unnamed protein product [Tuber aestivum]|uniref:Uncharacterized protein n=1 Tax=Tuber aestivum TaxID=59557 RepID=A0A292Q195_9PEZI|nr:unnamed protein product [Tuber aestivum]